MSPPESTAAALERLFAVIESRKGGDPDSSYTAQLYARGREKIAQKLGEEAVETVIAGLGSDPAALVTESADLLYHLLVLWADVGIAPEQIWQELDRRSGTSGLEEKRNR